MNALALAVLSVENSSSVRMPDDVTSARRLKGRLCPLRACVDVEFELKIERHVCPSM